MQIKRRYPPIIQDHWSHVKIGRYIPSLDAYVAKILHRGMEFMKLEMVPKLSESYKERFDHFAHPFKEVGE